MADNTEYGFNIPTILVTEPTMIGSPRETSDSIFSYDSIYKTSLETLEYTRKDRIFQDYSLIRIFQPDIGSDNDDERPVMFTRPGFAKLPSIPSRVLLFGGKKYDMWGREYCSTDKAVVVLLVCAIVPPMPLLLASGYLDGILGVIPRRIKLVSFGVGGLTVVAAIVAAIVLATT